MADQITPAEMREQAKHLRGWVRSGMLSGYEQGDGTASAWLDDGLQSGADALDRLADVIEYAGKQMGPPASEWEHDPATILQAIDRIARGETNERESHEPTR